MGSRIAEPEPVPLPPPDFLLEVRTGKIRPLGGVSLRSGIAKTRHLGKIEVTELGLAGDEQQYPLHGGVDKALHQYCASHYKEWNQEKPGRVHLYKIGGFGENLSSKMLTEKNVCIGDKFSLGTEVIIQVSEPRQPCYKLNHRFEWKLASTRTQESGRTGWYLRVLRPGKIEEGDKIELVERPNPTWSITRVQHYMYHDINNMGALMELSQLPGLGKEIQGLFQDRLHKGVEDMTDRLEGIAGKNRIPIAWQSYKLIEKSPLTSRVKKFVFTLADGAVGIENPELSAFSHVRLKLGLEASFTRAYSVVSGDLKKFELGIARDDNSRGGSHYLHEKIQVGDILEIAKGRETRQKDNLTSRQEARKHIFIIGGIGITAFLREVKALELLGAQYEIHYAVRSEKEAAYLGCLSPQKTKIYARDRGERLNIAELIPPFKGKSEFDTMIYCCGPSSLLSACRERTTALKYPAALVHLEDFGGPADSSGDPFEAEIKGSAQVLKVPSDMTLLQVLNNAGFDIPSSCLVGNCGVCMVNYCSGNVDHRGIALEEEQKVQSLLSCVSRGRGRIVVDSW